MRPYNLDKEFFGFKFRTRLRYFDEKIIKECLDEDKDIYRIPKNPKIVIDIGANIGCISLLAASRGAIVYAFEPNDDNFQVLRYNVKLNDFMDEVRCINLGVGKPGITKLYLHSKMSGTHSAYLQQKGLTEDNYQEVMFISIHDALEENLIDYCDLLKLDCEGSEADIIRDFDDSLVAKIGQISVEFHDKKIMPELIQKLERWYVGEHVHRYIWVFKKKL